MRILRCVISVLLAALLLLAFCGCGAQRGRTDRYDGYTVRTEKNPTSERAAEADAPTRTVDNETAEDYILNRSSKKFHYPDCSGARDIKERNRWEYRGTRKSVLDMRYEPCRICNP